MCRVYDLVEVEGRELLSMEHIDGETLLSLLKARCPLPLTEARDLALQFLAGLEAVHQSGLVHRDFKPENVMITRSGRVVVMDFGIAEKRESGDGPVSGTPAYMAPEQGRGEAVDARTDVYAVGVVLAEMVSTPGIRDRTSRKSVWEGIHEDPPRVPDSPWSPVIRKAVSADPEKRLPSAQALIRALEEITLRVEGAEEKHPYPGLASFTEGDAEHFFGREPEVEAMGRKLRRASLTALVGPSGAGKSSFLRAGLVPVLPEGWGHVYCQPGASPLASLARAVPREAVDETEGSGGAASEDPENVVAAFRRWRASHEEGLVILDQFEELFTLNTPEVQARFAELVDRLVSDAGVRVLVSMRDDFLFHCQAHEPLSPLFSELTPLGPPTGAALHRALVQPALALGYRFEDDSLVAEMLEEVSRERGALPLLAFAAASLWDRRDPDEGLLTREAYQAIGGVGGALAQHAEATLRRIGLEREPMVRELFRNLVTAQGTRAARDREELLSVFDDTSAAQEVLGELVAARLLTEFEATDLDGISERDPGSAPSSRGARTKAGDEGSLLEHRHTPKSSVRVEVIHESLLSAWPRLVRWRTQDADGAQLRDQLRQAARAWLERGRPEDLLWSGTSYREFEVWRERYPGGLTANEESFAEAMVHHARRRRRRRRTAVATAFVILVAVLAGVLGLWRRSEDARAQAVTETRRAEASRLVMLGRLEMDTDPTAALAYTTKGLELADLPAAREQVMEVLWGGPPRFLLTTEDSLDAAFSADGRWLARWPHGPPHRLEVWPADGGEPVAFPGEGEATFRTSREGGVVMVTSSPQEGTTDFLVRAAPEWSLAHRLSLEGWWKLSPEVADSSTLGFAHIAPPGLRFYEWALDGSPATPTGVLDIEVAVLRTVVADYSGAGLACLGRDGRAYVSLRDDAGQTSAAVVGAEHEAAGTFGFDRQGRRLAVLGADGRTRIYPLPPRPGPPLRVLTALPDNSPGSFDFSPDGSWLLSESDEPLLWGLTGPVEAEPTALRIGEPLQGNAARFDPSGRWMVVAASETSLLPVPTRRAHVIRAHEGSGSAVAFGPQGRWLVSASMDGTVRLWPLDGGAGQSSRLLFQDDNAGGVVDVDVDPAGENVLVGNQWGAIWVVPVDGSPPRRLEGTGGVMGVAFGPEGRRAAASGDHGDPAVRALRVWDLESGELTVLDSGDGFPTGWWLDFTKDGRLLAAGRDGTARLWDIEEGTYDSLPPGGESPVTGPVGTFILKSAITRGRFPSTVCAGQLDDLAHWSCHDLVAARSWPLDLKAHGATPQEFALDPSGTRIVSGDTLGNVRVGPVDGGPAHLLVGHEAPIKGLAISPDGRWIASIDNDGVLRLWPMPEGEPFHLLPREELIDRLHELTNLRVVDDEAAATGYRLDHDPFPGWKTVPTW